MKIGEFFCYSLALFICHSEGAFAATEESRTIHSRDPSLHLHCNKRTICLASRVQVSLRVTCLYLGSFLLWGEMMDRLLRQLHIGCISP